MPYEYSESSKDKLNTCHQDLIYLMHQVAKKVNVTIVCGWRSPKEQNELFRIGQSKLKGGQSKHNHLYDIGGGDIPQSLAVDAVPYFDEAPHIRWDDKLTQVYFAGVVKGVSIQLGIPIRCGADWNLDMNVSNNWLDAFHFELI